MKLLIPTVAVIHSLALPATANYEFTAWSEIGCIGNKQYSTSGDVFDSYCHNVQGQGWYSIGGSAMSIKGQALKFCASTDCTGNCVTVDDRDGCSFLGPPDYKGEIGSWEAIQE